MSQTPLTDAYLASRCKGENKQSWVEFARGLEEKLMELQAVSEDTVPRIRYDTAREQLQMQLGYLATMLMVMGDPRPLPEIIDEAVCACAPK